MRSLTNELCIMFDNPPYWRNYRFLGSERHEIFEGRTGNRDKSIKDGLVVFLTPEQHRLSKTAVHKCKETRLRLQEAGERVWCNYYNKTIDDFRKRYGKNYIE